MESQTTEYKEQWHDKYLAYISGFANAQGGTLYVGLNDSGEVVGINNAKYLLENLPNKAIQATGIIPDIEILDEDGKDYLAIRIKQSRQPVTCNGKYYVRSGSTLQELGGVALQQFLLDKLGYEWDAFPCEHATIEDIDLSAIDYFVRNAVSSGRMPNSALTDNAETILHNLNLVTKDGQLTNAAILLFGQNPQSHFITAHFRIGRFGIDDTDLIHQDEIDGNLIQMADKVMWKLRTDYLTAPIHYEGMHRVEQLEIPEDALRELVYNAIVHRDYLGTNTQMKVYDDRIWFWNAGVLPDGFNVEKVSAEHLSNPRNHLIANVFYRAGFIESWGRGISKVCKAFAQANLAAPTFENFWNGTLVQMPRSFNKQAIDQVNDQVNDQIESLQLTDNEKKVYYLIKEFDQVNNQNDQVNDQVTTGYIAQHMGLSYSTIKRILRVLKQHNVIQRVGSDKTGYWQPKKP